MDSVILPEYFYNLLYIIDLIDLERDLMSGVEELEFGGRRGGYKFINTTHSPHI